MKVDGTNGHRPRLTAYDTIQTLPKCDIAWEFLRRNADYRRDFELYGSDTLIREPDWQGYPIYRQTRICEAARRWGLSALCAPDQAAPVKDLFWLTDYQSDTPSVLIARGSGAMAETLLCANLRFLIDIENNAKLYITIGPTVISLPVVSGSLFENGHDIALVLNHLQQVKGAERLLRAFRHWRNPRPRTAQRLWLRDALIAFDGDNAGLRYREIACQIFGDARVDADWHVGFTALKDQTRRAVRRGRKLVDGGYFDLVAEQAPSRVDLSRRYVSQASANGAFTSNNRSVVS